MAVVTNAKLGLGLDARTIRPHLSGEGIQFTLLIDFLSQYIIDFAHILSDSFEESVDWALVLGCLG